MLKKEDFFTPAEIDALGETYNISMGSSAKAINMLLGRVVNITTPFMDVITSSDFHFSEMGNALAVEVNYVEGLIGRNLLILKKEDIRKMLEIMMMRELDPDTFEIDEMSESAVCEIMNQMMGSAATAMSEFLEMSVNISTPKSMEIFSEDFFKRTYFELTEIIVLIKFDLDVEDLLKSEFYNIMKIDFARNMLKFIEIAKSKHE